MRMRGPLQILTDFDEDATIVSIDGIGAYDLISRPSMLDGLGAMETGEKFFLFVRSFYGASSIYLWEDEMGTIHEIRQGEGGEQGDPLLPLLFSLGQHRALVAGQARLRKVRILGRRVHHLCARPGCPQDFCRRNSGGTRRFNSITGRRRCGFGAAGVGPRRSCGEGTTHCPFGPKGSKFWVFPLATRILWRNIWSGRRENTKFLFLSESRQLKTSTALGWSFFSSQPHEQMFG